MSRVVYIERPRRIGRSYVEAVLRRARILALASSTVAPAKAWIDEAVVVALPQRGVAAAPSLTGATTTTQSSGGDDA